MEGPWFPLAPAGPNVTLSRKNTSNCDRGGSAFRTNFRKTTICSVKLLVVKTHPTVTDARLFWHFWKVCKWPRSSYFTSPNSDYDAENCSKPQVSRDNTSNCHSHISHWRFICQILFFLYYTIKRSTKWPLICEIVSRENTSNCDKRTFVLNMFGKCAWPRSLNFTSPIRDSDAENCSKPQVSRDNTSNCDSRISHWRFIYQILQIVYYNIS